MYKYVSGGVYQLTGVVWRCVCAVVAVVVSRCLLPSTVLSLDNGHCISYIIIKTSCAFFYTIFQRNTYPVLQWLKMSLAFNCVIQFVS